MKTDFPNGVLWYTKKFAVVEVNFPEDAVCCQNCEWCRAEKELSRYFCRLTGRQVYNPYYSVDEERCPLMSKKNFVEVINNSFTEEDLNE